MFMSTNTSNTTMATICSNASIFEFQITQLAFESGVSGLSADTPDESWLSSETNLDLYLREVLR